MDEQLKKFLFNPYLGKMIAVFIGIIIIWTFIKAIRRGFASRIKDKDNRYHTKKIISFLGYFFSAILIAFIYSDKLGKFTVILGVTGLGIAVALQEIIASIAGWFVIVFGGHFHTGDRVQLAGIKGDIIDIGILRTTLMEIGQWVDADLYNGRIVSVSNSSIFKEPIFNYSADFPFLWDEIKIPVQFGCDYKLAEQILIDSVKEKIGQNTDLAHHSWEKMLNKYMIEDTSTEPVVTFVLNESWIEFTIRYIVDFKKRRSTKNILFHKILSEIEASEGKVKFASPTNRLI